MQGRDDEDETTCDPIYVQFNEELGQAIEQGVDAVNRLTRAWTDEHPELADRFRIQANVRLMFHGIREPERLGKYQLLSVLAVGGMGKIYKAKEDVTGRIVVVKTIRSGNFSTAEQMKRFDGERKLLSKLHHSNIIPLLSTEQDGNLMYMVMPFIQGVTLQSVIQAAASSQTTNEVTDFQALFMQASTIEEIRRKGSTLKRDDDEISPGTTVPWTEKPLSHSDTARLKEYLRRVVRTMEQVALAVQHIHDAKILHRDLKPANIMIELTGHSWVIDIGLGRKMHDDGPDNPTMDPDCETNRGMTQGIGTLAYMAPEQVTIDLSRSIGFDERTDIWGLGVTLYELLTFRTPFRADRACDLIERIKSKDPEPMDRWIPDELAAICLKALRKEPEKRYGTSLDFATDLRRWLDQYPTRAGEEATRQNLGTKFGTKLGTMLGVFFVSCRSLSHLSRRHPGATIAATLAAMLLLLLASGVAVYAQEKTRTAKRERQMLELTKHRRPTRRTDWFNSNWQEIRALRGSSTLPDPQLQGHAAAALEGIDAHKVKSFDGAARDVRFDGDSQRLLMVGAEKNEKNDRLLRYRTTLWDQKTYQTVVERELGDGIVAFRSDGTPIQLSFVSHDPAVTEFSKTLRLYDVESGNVMHEYHALGGETFSLNMTALAQQGTRLAAIAIPVRPEKGKPVPEGASAIAVWDTDSEKPILTFDAKIGGEIQGLVLSPDGLLLAVWDNSGQIAVWTLPDGKELSRFRAGRMPVNCLAFGRDPVWHNDESKPRWLLAVAESSGLITTWDFGTNRPRSVCRGSEYFVSAMDFSDDGALLLSAGRTPMKIWDVATGTCVLDLFIKDEMIATDFSPNSRYLAISSVPPTGPAEVDLVELEFGHGIRTLYGLQGVVEKTFFSPDGRFVAAASHEWQIGVWELPSGELRGVIPAPVGIFVDSVGIAFDAEGQRMACSDGHEAQLWDIQAERLIQSWNLHEGLCDSLAFVEPNRLLLIRSETQSGRTGPFRDSDPSKDSDPLVDPRVVRIYDLLSANPTVPINFCTEFPMHVYSIALAPTGVFFAVEGLDNDRSRRCMVYDVKSPEKRPFELRTSLQIQNGSKLSWDPSGRVLGAILDPTGRFQTISLFRVADQKFLGSTDAFIGCLSPNAKWGLCDVVDDRTPLVLIDVKSGRSLLRLFKDVDANAGFSAFSPDDKRAAIGRKDGTVIVLNLAEINRRLSELDLGW